MEMRGRQDVVWVIRVLHSMREIKQKLVICFRRGEMVTGKKKKRKMWANTNTATRSPDEMKVI